MSNPESIREKFLNLLNDEGLDFDGFFMAAFKDDNDGDFEPTFAQTADADDVTVTANGDTEILDLHWITVKKP